MDFYFVNPTPENTTPAENTFTFTLDHFLSRLDIYIFSSVQISEAIYVNVKFKAFFALTVREKAIPDIYHDN